MSDTTTCPNCSAALPAGATFCTSCGTRIEVAAPTADATRGDTPGLHDATQQFTPPAAPWQPAEAAPPPAPPAWQAPPAAAPAPPAAGGWAGAAPAAPPAPTGAPWQQAPGAPAQPAWGTAPGQPAWGAPAPAAASSSGAAGASPLGGIVAVLGGALTIVGLFSAWLGNNVDSTKLAGWDLTRDDVAFTSKDPYLLLVLGIVGVLVGAALFLGKARNPVRLVAIVVGLAIVGTHIRDWMSIADVVKDSLSSDFKVTAQIGFYLGIAGGILVALSSLIPGKKSTPTSV